MWTTQRLAELLSELTGVGTVGEARHHVALVTAESLDAELVALFDGPKVLLAIGLGPHPLPVEAVRRAWRPRTPVDIPPLGVVDVAGAEVPSTSWELVVGRRAEAFSPEETTFVRAAAQALSLHVRALTLLGAERSATARAEHLLRDVAERQALLERLSRIQRSMSHRAPLAVILDGIVGGAVELLEVEVGALRLFDLRDPSVAVLVAHHGIPDAVVREFRRQRVDRDDGFRCLGTTGSVNAPLHDSGTVVGSLLVATTSPTRRFTAAEVESLHAFAEHASLALGDARTIESLQHAYQDGLTRLPNRVLFLERVDQALAETSVSDVANIGVAAVAVGGLHDVNWSLGFDVGDLALQAAAKALSSRLPGVTAVGRVAAATFGALIEAGLGITPDEVATRIEAEVGAALADVSPALTCTVRVVTSGDDPIDGADLLLAAREAVSTTSGSYR